MQNLFTLVRTPTALNLQVCYWDYVPSTMFPVVYVPTGLNLPV